MVKKHEKFSVVYDVPTEKYLEFFTDSTKVINALVELDEIFDEFIEGNSDVDDVFDALDELVLSCNSIYFVAASFSSVNESRNKYLRNTSEVLEVFNDNVTQITSVGRYPTEADIEILKKELYEVVGGLTYFLMYDYEIFDTLAEIEAGEVNYTIDEVFDGYLKVNCLSVQEFTNVFVEYFKKYKFKLEIFDEHPELEEEFEKIVGPDYNLIPEGTLTIEVVQQIIAGTLSIENFLASLVDEDEV